MLRRRRRTTPHRGCPLEGHLGVVDRTDAKDGRRPAIAHDRLVLQLHPALADRLKRDPGGKPRTFYSAIIQNELSRTGIHEELLPNGW
jgi:hypothetical protein